MMKKPILMMTLLMAVACVSPATLQRQEQEKKLAKQALQARALKVQKRKKIQLKIVISDEDRKTSKLPFKRTAQAFLKTAKIRTTSRPVPGGGRLEIKILTYALSEVYGNPSFGYLGIGRSTQYTGAFMSGHIALYDKQGLILTRPFQARIDPPRQTILKYGSRDKAPFRDVWSKEGSMNYVLLNTLKNLYGPKAMKAAFKSKNKLVLKSAIQVGSANGKMRSQYIKKIRRLAAYSNSEVGEQAIQTLYKYSDSKTNNVLLKAVKRNSKTRGSAAVILASKRDIRIPPLAAKVLLKSWKDPEVSTKLLDALVAYNDYRIFEPVLKYLTRTQRVMNSPYFYCASNCVLRKNMKTATTLLQNISGLRGENQRLSDYRRWWKKNKRQLQKKQRSLAANH